MLSFISILKKETLFQNEKLIILQLLKCLKKLLLDFCKINIPFSLGLAYESICGSKATSVSKDRGMMSALTVAHEMAHKLVHFPYFVWVVILSFVALEVLFVLTFFLKRLIC